MRTPLPGHRRYRITHRAVQRLRELVAVIETDDEILRDRLDHEIARAEDAGKAMRTLDVMLGNAQVLVPLAALGDLYAIIKEDTVVTVLPRAHGEELVQRGEALQRRVADALAPAPPRPRDDPWGWRGRRSEAFAAERVVPSVAGGRLPVAAEPEVVIKPSRSTIASRERADRAQIVTDDPTQPGRASRSATQPAPEPAPATGTEQTPATAQPEPATGATPPEQLVGTGMRPGRVAGVPPETSTTRGEPERTVAAVLARGLALGRRRAAARALVDILRREPSDAPLLTLWPDLTQATSAESLTVGDLAAALRGPSR